MFLGKGVLKIRSKFTGEQPCRSVISKFQSHNNVMIQMFLKIIAVYRQKDIANYRQLSSNIV